MPTWLWMSEGVTDYYADLALVRTKENLPSARQGQQIIVADLLSA